MANVKRAKGFWRIYSRVITIGLIAVAALGWLFLHRLGSLTGGMSGHELATVSTPVGWHGIYHNAFYLPLKLVQSVIFWLSPDHGQVLSRLPNALFGGLTVVLFSWLIWLWHGPRTAFFSTLLFATSAWVLHVSRVATYDVLYLWALPTILIVQVMLHRYGDRAIVRYGSLLAWGLLLYVPGMVWLVLLQLWWQRALLIKAWSQVVSWQRQTLSVLAIFVWLPLLGLQLTRPGQLALWLGLPHHVAGPLHLLKQFVGVFVHLFVRGPQYPEIWLGKAPILDVFALLTVGLGIYFYVKNKQASRSRIIASLFGFGLVLIALAGPVTLSFLVPLLYVTGAAGIAYLLHDWLKVFPRNPLARSLGIGLITVAVLLSCMYNLRAYFVAWPHQATTKTMFRQHL
jgi:hypothetical protein